MSSVSADALPTLDELATDDAWSDVAVAEGFAADQAGQLCRNHRTKDWLVFGPHRWQPDRDGAIKRRFVDYVRRLQQRALDIPDLKVRKRTLGLALQFEQQPRIERALSYAAAARPLTDTGDGWNSDPLLLGVPNGVVDLRTGALRPGVPEDRITMSAAVGFYPEAPSPRWDRFVHEIMGADLELANYLHRAVGYSVTFTDSCPNMPCRMSVSS